MLNINVYYNTSVILVALLQTIAEFALTYLDSKFNLYNLLLTFKYNF